MKVQIIYCHPSEKSYTYEMLTLLKLTLTQEGLEFEVSDLYAMNFQTDMTEQEYAREGCGDLSLPIPDDVRKEQLKIEQSDCLIFVYPVWWSDCPAKLKGWFDRVFSVGYAYGNSVTTKDIRKMKPIPYGMAICTAGHPNELLDEIGIAESMRNIMIDDRLGKRFLNKEMIILGGTLDKEKARPLHSNIIATIGAKIKNAVPGI